MLTTKERFDSLYSSIVCYQSTACLYNPLSWPRGSRKLDNLDVTDLRVLLYEATGFTASLTPENNTPTTDKIAALGACVFVYQR